MIAGLGCYDSQPLAEVRSCQLCRCRQHFDSPRSTSVLISPKCVDFPMDEPIAIIDGQVCPASEARISVCDLGVVMGASVTEMVRTFSHRPFRLQDHLMRLMRGVHSAGFPAGIDPQMLQAHVEPVVGHNAALLNEDEDLGVVVFVTAGKNLTYLGAARRAEARQPTQCVHSFRLPCELWAAKMAAGQHLVVPSVRQMPAETLDPRIKSRSRMHWYVADQQARIVDPQAAALVLDQSGNVAETSTGNVFVVKNGVLKTPRPHVALEGVSQHVVRELAEQMGVTCIACDLHPLDVLNADEVFTSSTPYCVMPVTRFNGQPIGCGQSGPMFARILSAWNKMVGLDIMRQISRMATDRETDM